MQIISLYFAVTKPKIIILLLITAAGGLFLASEGWPNLIVTLSVLIGGALTAGGANSINNFWDRDIDQKMDRTKNKRHVATGKVNPIGALIFGIVLNIIGFTILWQYTNLISGILAISATLFYVFIYTIGLKRYTSQNIVIGGAAGAIPPVIGWSAVTGDFIHLAPITLFALIFLWTPPHFWALSLLLKDDYKKAGIPMLPVVSGVHHTKVQIFIYTLVLLIFGIISWVFVDQLGPIYGITTLLVNLGFIVFAWKLLKDKEISLALPTYLFSLAYLAAIFLAISLESLII
tara:strand:- start:1387 stop:2256 length:870 start_codon:yes stop_codon:yes gene_type:complete